MTPVWVCSVGCLQELNSRMFLGNISDVVCIWRQEQTWVKRDFFDDNVNGPIWHVVTIKPGYK